MFIVSIVTAWNDWKKEAQFIKLTEFSDQSNVLVVLRAGEEKTVNVDDLHAGDIVQIKTGMDIPVDAILIRGSGVTTDESAMTGEQDEMKKETVALCLKRYAEHLEDEE